MTWGSRTLRGGAAQADITQPGRTSGRLLSLLVALGALAALAGSPGVAWAGVGATEDSTFATPVTVGDTNQPASLAIQNTSDAPNTANPMTVTTIHATLSCGTFFTESPAATEVCPQPQPGVFSLSSTGTGRAGTACAGTTFTIALIDAPTGKVSFNPPAPVMLAPPGAGDTCVIDFTFNVLSSPTIDCYPGFQGIQTCTDTTVYGNVSGVGPGGQSSNFEPCDITVFPPVVGNCAASPAPPVVPGTTLTTPTTPVQAQTQAKKKKHKKKKKKKKTHKIEPQFTG